MHRLELEVRRCNCRIKLTALMIWIGCALLEHDVLVTKLEDATDGDAWRRRHTVKRAIFAPRRPSRYRPRRRWLSNGRTPTRRSSGIWRPEIWRGEHLRDSG